MRVFEKAFHPPFRVDKMINWVYDDNNNFCFQFVVDLDEKQCEQFEKVINKEITPNNFNTYTHKGGMVKLNGNDIILIRGWGYLTGTGGLNLSGEEAAAIQDDLADYIVETLKGK